MRTGAIAALVVASVACGGGEQAAPPLAPTAEVPGTTASSDVDPAQAASYVDQIEFAPGARRAANTQMAYDPNTFVLGDPVTLGMTVRDAPPGTAVKVIWYGPKGRMNAETKEAGPRDSRLEFQTRETSAWGVGEGRAEVWVGDEKIAEPEFTLVQAR